MTNMFSGSLVAMVCAGSFALVLGAIGVILIVMYLKNKQKAKESTGWPATEGIITRHEIKVDQSSRDDGVFYLPVVHYEYQVNDIAYQGKRVAFGSEPSFGSRKKAEAFFAPFPLEGTTKVFYNPDQPSEAVLSQTMRKMTASLIVGIALIVVMVCLLCPVLMGLVNVITGLLS